jgi:mono/diheme cytochrome c family protein
MKRSELTREQVVRCLRRFVMSGMLTTGVAAPATVAGAAVSDAAFEQHCVACHGADARGIDNLGVDLVASAFVAATSEQGLVEFLQVGRLPDDPATRTGRPMPGFSWVSESELESIAAFLKSRSGK